MPYKAGLLCKHEQRARLGGEGEGRAVRGLKKGGQGGAVKT